MKIFRATGPVLAVTAWSALCFWAGLTSAREPALKVDVLLETSKTVIGEPIRYPTQKPAKVTAAIVTVPVGATTGWHSHGVPLFAYMLEGALKVDYGPDGERVYKTGDALIEAVNLPHVGTNAGPLPAKVLAVFMGAEGLENTFKTPPPARH